LASIGATAAVSKAFGDAQALMLAQKRLSRLTQEYKQFAGAQQEAERLANKFEVSVTDTAGALGSLASRLGAQGRSLNDIVAVYEGLNSALVATGRSSTEAAAASYQLSQALGSGSLTGDELKTISETLPELLNEVAKAAGVSSLQIRELAKDGKLSADLIIQATKQLRDKYSQDVEANITATQKFQNALGGLSEAVGTELAPAITELLKAGAEALKLFGKLPGPVKTLIAAIAGLTAAFVALAPAISTVIGLLGGLSQLRLWQRLGRGLH
jgi:tape measure domain-containing protein